MLCPQPAIYTQPALIVGTWNHLFENDNGERMTRIVLDASTQRLIHMEVQSNRALNESFRKATRCEIDDVEDSLVNANGDLFDNPDGYGLEATSELPAWVSFNVGACEPAAKATDPVSVLSGAGDQD